MHSIHDEVHDIKYHIIITLLPLTNFILILRVKWQFHFKIIKKHKLIKTSLNCGGRYLCAIPPTLIILQVDLVHHFINATIITLILTYKWSLHWTDCTSSAAVCSTLVLLPCLELEFFLQLTDSQPVRLGIGPPFGTLGQILSCSSFFIWQLLYSSFEGAFSDEKAGL
jgi:hypothetical protein